MRDEGGEDLFKTICSRAEMLHGKHMNVYGVFNERRMTGHHETSSYATFSHGVGSRNTSFRVPNSVVEDEWKGYLEDRRPASNCDPYRVAKCVLEILE
jgi:glutamine synthetase